MKTTAHPMALNSPFLCIDRPERPFMSPFPAPRCRKCSGCLSHRRWIWQSRVKAEIAISERTWFVTLTYKTKTDQPEWEISYDLVQKWLKRVRKHHGLRYLCVAERGTKGTKRIHFHLLLHGANSLTQKAIRNVWHVSDGISHARLCQKRDIEYITKYATKDDGPVRASNAYGRYNQGAIASRNEILREIRRQFPKATLAGIKHDGTPLPRAIVKNINLDFQKALRLDGTTYPNS